MPRSSNPRTASLWTNFHHRYLDLLPQIPLGAEAAGIGADDLEELASDKDEYFRLGQEDEEFKDYSSLKLKPDHLNRLKPLSVPVTPPPSHTQPGMRGAKTFS